MRYTTIIDIREFRSIWRSDSCRTLYLYACLACGYEDYNRDLLQESIRQLADHTGLTVSATRHALGQLAKARLIVKATKGYKVAKWLQSPTISPRELNKRQTKQQQADEAAARYREEQQQRLKASLEAARVGAVSYEEYLEIKKRKGT